MAPVRSYTNWNSRTTDNEVQKDNQEIAFDKERDKMIIVFDADIFEEKVQDYDKLVASGEKDNILAVTNPAFELFLLLHFENSYEQDILPNEEAIIKNGKKEIRRLFISYCWEKQALIQRKIQKLEIWQQM